MTVTGHPGTRIECCTSRSRGGPARSANPVIRKPSNRVVGKEPMPRNIVIRFLVAPRIYSIFLLIVIGGSGYSAFAATAFTGSLTDPQGLAVPDAIIRLQRRADSTQRQVTTDAQGHFSLAGLKYRLTAESPGFAELTRTVVVQADGQQNEDVQFTDVASQKESVTVAASVSDVGV